MKHTTHRKDAPQRQCAHELRGCCKACSDPMATPPTPFRRVKFAQPRSAKQK